MKTRDIVVGGIYKNSAGKERYAIAIVDGDVVYLGPFELFKQSSIKSFARWAKERIS